MKIFNQGYFNNCQNFTGRVDSSVERRVKTLEKELINDYVERQNNLGENVDQLVIEEIKSRFKNSLEHLREKAKSLFKDSVIVCQKDNRIQIENDKLKEKSGSLVAQNKWDGFDVNEHNKFEEKAINNFFKKDPITRTEYAFSSDISSRNVEYNVKYHPQNLTEFETMVEFFRPKRINNLMLNSKKQEVLDSISYDNSTEPSLKVKKLVQNIQSVERELPPGDRDTNFWTTVKKECNKNAEQETID